MNERRWWIFGGGATLLVFGLVAASAGVANGGSGPEPGMKEAAAVEVAVAAATDESPLVTLYKNPTCACCADWAEHMRANGFRVDVKEGVSLAAVKEQNDVPFSLSSCHTAVVDGYALEGHVPADVVQKLLLDRPDVAGLAVPGMPPGVPGMPGEGLGSYEVLAFQADGSAQVYATK
jgi:hypothetical protein